jgi:hypothetical protein
VHRLGADGGAVPPPVAAALAAWQDDLAAAILRSITTAPCGCWLVAGADGELLVPCASHDIEWWEI